MLAEVTQSLLNSGDWDWASMECGRVFYSPLLRCAGDWVAAVGAKHARACIRDTIIKIYSEEGDLT